MSSRRAQLAEVERRRMTLEASYQEEVEELEELRARLSDVGEGIEQERIGAAKAALAEGDTSLADQIFAEVEAMEQASIERAAEAAYQRASSSSRKSAGPWPPSTMPGPRSSRQATTGS